MQEEKKPRHCAMARQRMGVLLRPALDKSLGAKHPGVAALVALRGASNNMPSAAGGGGSSDEAGTLQICCLLPAHEPGRGPAPEAGARGRNACDPRRAVGVPTVASTGVPDQQIAQIARAKCRG